MLALCPCKLAVGVKVAVRLRPVPLMAPKVPPETSTSPLKPFQAKLSPGSSLKVKLMVAVSPILSAGLSLLMLRLGARVSREIEGAAPAPPLLPAGSW